MEDWQCNLINSNIIKLMNLTICNVSLLAELQTKSILSINDIQTIDAAEINLQKSWKLYDILKQRQNSYQALISALLKTCQSGAAAILQGGLTSHMSIEFQEAVISISELLPNLDEKLRKELLSLQQEKPRIDRVVVKNTIPSNLNYYISRKILSRKQLNESLFQENCSDIFLFHGIEWSDLELLVNEFPTQDSNYLLDPSDELKTRHVLLEFLEHFDIIVKKTIDPVHLIQHTNGFYYWIKSRGKVQTIQKYVNTSSHSIIKEETFIDEILKDNISTLFTDSPGMGKTVLLANLARAIRNRYPKRLVIFIHLREFVAVLQARLINGIQLDSQLIQILVSEICSDHLVGRRIVSFKLEHDHSHLFFDGFDEVLQEQQKVAKDMLKLIAKSFKKCQTFVTARSHMRQELEQTMETLGFDIVPFNNANKIEFFENFWGSEKRFIRKENEDEILTKNITVKYAEMCIRILAGVLSELEKDIAGTPLLCYMIGEVLIYRLEGKDTNMVFEEEVPIISLAQLYEKHINTRLTSLKAICNIESLKQAHIHSAIALLFPEEVSNFVTYPVDISIDQLCDAGIIDRVTPGSIKDIRFVHRTFAEYFVGLFAVKLLSNVDNESLRFILEKILATSERHKYFIENQLGREWFKMDPICAYRQPVIAYFLNYHLQQQRIALTQRKEFQDVCNWKSPEKLNFNAFPQVRSRFQQNPETFPVIRVNKKNLPP